MPQLIGQDPNYMATCGNCGARFTFRRDELRAGAEKPNSPDRDHYTVVPCPQCRQAVDVTSKTYSTSYETARQQQRDDDY